MSDLITAKEASALLGVTDRTLRNWENQGYIDAVKTVGGHRRYHRSSLLNPRSSMYLYFLIHDDGFQTRYKSKFLPRIGDTICIGELYFRVNNMVMNTAKEHEGGTQHTLEVHVSSVDPIALSCDPYETEVLELDEFCQRVKGVIESNDSSHTAGMLDGEGSIQGRNSATIDENQ